MSTITEALAEAVPLHIEAIRSRGGPTDADYYRLSGLSETLGERGDILLFGSKVKGEQADLFNRTAEAIAMLSFLPGGIRLFGGHWESKPTT